MTGSTLNAYLDIEASFEGDITVIGIYYAGCKLIQLADDRVDYPNLLDAIERGTMILTYNGSRFDLPVIRAKTGIDLTKHRFCRDLMYDCWRHNLYGGLKKVENILGIKREAKEIAGYGAMLLWDRYRKYSDLEALNALLQYNRDDTINLHTLHKRLDALDRK
ncbi:MAG: ribonuclease H-like domain-containing protein [Pseudomonadota bacterium]